MVLRKVILRGKDLEGGGKKRKKRERERERGGKKDNGMGKTYLLLCNS